MYEHFCIKRCTMNMSSEDISLSALIQPFTSGKTGSLEIYNEINLLKKCLVLKIVLPGKTSEHIKMSKSRRVLEQSGSENAQL